MDGRRCRLEATTNQYICAFPQQHTPSWSTHVHKHRFASQVSCSSHQIKEWLSNPHNTTQFHIEPYELLWKPTKHHKEVKLYGELYTSEAFIKAHHELQESPCKPLCDLQQVVVSLMFWSDATHLTLFRNTHLWPCYLFLGNKSQYQRCKPSCNLCSHVVYFQSVHSIFCGIFIWFADVA